MFEAVDSKEPIQETGTISNTGNTLVEVVDSKESHSMKSTTTMNGHKKSNRNGASKMEEVKDQKVVKPNGGMKSGNDTDLWWFSLPYVLVCIWIYDHFLLVCFRQLVFPLFVVLSIAANLVMSKEKKKDLSSV